MLTKNIKKKKKNIIANIIAIYDRGREIFRPPTTLKSAKIIIRDDKHISMNRPNTQEEERLIRIEGEKRIASEIPNRFKK
jgi:hypothetical protein